MPLVIKIIINILNLINYIIPNPLSGLIGEFNTSHDKDINCVSISMLIKYNS